MITTTLNTLKLHLNLNTALHSIVLTACTPSSVTHLMGNILEKKGKEKLNLETEPEHIRQTQYHKSKDN